MEMPSTAAGERLRELAGYIRLLTALVKPAPNRESLDRRVLARVLKDLAARLDQVAQETELCRDCPARTCEEERP